MPELVYNVKFKIDTNIQDGAAGVTAYKERVEELEAQIQQLTGSQREFNNESKKTGQQTNRLNKSFSTANQALFSFSDLTQDATQFSQGFSSGMRAIGNNIGFTAELLANLSSRVGEYNELNKEAIASGEAQAKTVGTELRNSFAGAAGGLILLNLAVSAFTILSNQAEKRVKKLREEAKAFTDVITQVNSQFSEIDSQIPDPLGFRQREAELRLLQNAFGNVSKTVEKDYLKQIGNAALATGRLEGGLIGLLAQFDFTRDLALSFADVMGLVNKETAIQVLAFEELSKEIQKQQMTQEAFEKFLRQDGNETLKEYVDLTKLLSSAIAIDYANSILLERNSLISLNDEQVNSVKLREDLGLIIDKQSDAVNLLIETKGIENEETVKEIALLSQVIKLYDDLTNSVNSARKEIQDLTNINISSTNQFSALDIELSSQLERLDELQRKYPELSYEINKAKQSVTEYADRQRAAIGADAIAGIAQAAGQFGEIFGASKEFRIAMATIDAIAAVISTFATVPFPANIAVAAGIAASLASQIKSMESTDIGSGGASKVTGASASSFGFSMSNVQGPQTFRTPAFTPTSGDGRSTQKVDVKIMADRKQLYAMVKRGEEEYRQIKV